MKHRTGFPLAIVAGLIAASPAQADPLESLNRAMFTFNDNAVYYVIDPLAQAADTWIPGALRTAGSNVYENLTEPEFIVAHSLAGNGGAAADSTYRMIINSTLGIGGLFDVASRLGIRRQQIEFGEALCQAGLPTGQYLVLPLVGPTNAVTATAVSGFIVGGWFVLSLVSTTLATADLVLDLSASAASLRYAGDVPDQQARDPYSIQREEYLAYLAKSCPSDQLVAEHRAAP
jgi:phospholipid-binding lipoprotein MlaA